MGKLKNLFRNGKKYKTGLILSGGGARGFAHAGALKALNEAGIYPEILSCVSAGAMVGAFYADGKSPDEIYEIFSKGTSFFDYVKITLPKTGFFKTVGLKDNLSKHLEAVNFEDLKLPLYVAATNLSQGKINYFNTGSLLDKIMASAAIPVLFDPVRIEGEVFVDGGVVDNFPISPIKNDCRQLIGVFLNPLKKEEDFSNLIQIAERTFHLSVSSEIEIKKSMCDILIEPEELADFGMLDVSSGEKMFRIGYETTKKNL